MENAVCPITFDKIIHPVTVRETPTAVYELAALAKWIRQTHSNPMTRSPVLWSDLILLEDSEEAKEILKHEMSV